MKKLIVAGVMLASVMGAARADTVNTVQPYTGGFWIIMQSGANCGMGVADSTANLIYSAGLTGMVNALNNSILLAAGNTGWGAQSYGSNTCSELQLNR